MYILLIRSVTLLLKHGLQEKNDRYKWVDQIKLEVDSNWVQRVKMSGILWRRLYEQILLKYPTLYQDLDKDIEDIENINIK